MSAAYTANCNDGVDAMEMAEIECCDGDRFEEIQEKNSFDQNCINKEHDGLDDEFTIGTAPVIVSVQSLVPFKKKKPNYCESCNKTFFNTNNYRRHLKTIKHKKINPYKCEDCQIIFTHEEYFLTHKKNIHSCGVKRQPERLLKQNQYDCELSSLEMDSEMNHDDRMDLVHGELRMNYLQCNKCSFHSNDEQDFMLHEKKHTTINLSESYKSVRSSTRIQRQLERQLNQNQYDCEICSLKIDSEINYNDHMELVHHKFRMKYFQCGQCLFYSNNERELILHETKHSEPKLSKSYVNKGSRTCYKSFEPQTNYMQPTNSYRDIEPFVCGRCYACYYTLKKFENHLRVHSDNPIQCKYCFQKFTYELFLNKHLERIHGVVLRENEESIEEEKI